MIRKALLLWGTSCAMLGCGSGYYTYYPKDWIPADSSALIDDREIAQARGECQMQAIEQEYPERSSYFESCMTSKGYEREFDLLGRPVRQ